MRTDIAVPPSWLLFAWTLATASLMFAVPPLVSQQAPDSAAFNTHTSAAQAATGAQPDMFGRYDGNPGDDESIFDALDFSDASELISAGFEDAQYCVAHLKSQCWRTGRTLHARHFDSTARTEPRFLRYARLLN